MVRLNLTLMSITKVTHIGEIIRLTLACVRRKRVEASSVLKEQCKTGSPSSEAVQLRIFKRVLNKWLSVRFTKRTIQSSLRLDIEVPLIVMSGIFRSAVVVVAPLDSVETTM